MEKHTSKSIMRTGTFMLLGGTAGFAMGLLLAPEKGNKTRRRLIYHLERAAWRATALVERLIQSEAESEARRTGDALVADAQAQAQRIRDDIDELLGEMRRHSGEVPATD